MLSKPLASSYLAQASVALAASRYCSATENLPPWMLWGESSYPGTYWIGSHILRRVLGSRRLALEPKLLLDTETSNPGRMLMDIMAITWRKEGVLSSGRMRLGVFLTRPETIRELSLTVTCPSGWHTGRMFKTASYRYVFSKSAS